MSRRDALALWILRRLAPDDAEAALEDLREESTRQGGVGGRSGFTLARFWIQVMAVGVWGLRDRLVGLAGGRLRPGRAARMAAQGLARSPGTAVTAILTLGVGLGATVTLLGVIHGMFRPLPVPGGEQIVRGELRTFQGAAAPLTREVLELWRRPAAGLAGAGAFRTFTTTLEDGEGYAERRSGAAVTPDVLQLLDVAPLAGRLPTDAPADAGAVLVGYDLWQERYEGRPDVVGSSLQVEGRWRVVVGVMPPGFAFPYRQELWTVLDPTEAAALAGAELVARMDGQADGDVVGTSLEAGLARLPDAGRQEAPRRARVRSFVGGRGEGGELVALAGLGVLVTLLLVVCAANVSTLMLVRASERARVMAVHAALGAPRLQVALQLMLESAWIALAGGAVGVLLGGGLLSWIQSRLAVHWGYYWMRMELRPEVVLWTSGFVLVAALVAGTLPAIMAMRTDLRSVLSAGRGRGGGGRPSALGRWFVGCQVALSTAGLVAAVFLGAGVARSGALVENLPLDEVVVASVPLAGALPDDPEVRRATVESLIREMANLGNASASVGLPSFGAASARLERPKAPEGDPPVAYWSAVDPAHFGVHRLSLVRGRLLWEGDGREEPVVVVNESFIRRFLPGREPLGTLVSLEDIHEAGRPARIVGVVTDHVEERAGTRSDRVFLPLEGRDAGAVTLSVRTGRATEAGLALREAVRRADPSLPVEDVRTLRAFMDYLARVPRILGLFGVLGGAAGVLVAAIGLYGVIAFQVRSRLSELGVRMALGAGAGRVLGEVVGEGVRRILPGLAVGLGLGALASPLLAAFLFGLSPWSLLVYVGVAVGMVAVAVAASLVPAVRAARLDPLTVLRTE